uniref:hypothetical protein n=1 Tax=Francisella tularensis TaxID=263 RepID=UPI001C0F06EB
FVVPAFRKVTRRPASKKVRMQKMQYEVDRERFERVSEQLGTSTVAEVGRKTFDYYYDREIEND